MKIFRSLTFIGTMTLLSGACGGHSSITAPTSSASVSNPGPSASGASISGTLVGALGTNSFRTMAVGTITVTVNNSSITSTVDASGHFTLSGVPSGQIELHFTGPGLDARIVLQDVTETQKITITVRVTGASAELDDDERENANEVEVEGTVQSVSATSITVGTKTFTVTSTTQVVQDGRAITMADIHPTDRVHVHGTMAAAGLSATKIQLKTPRVPGNDANEVEVKGAIVGALGGTCPASRTFTVGTRNITTTATTQFREVACADLKTGSIVEVKGTLVNGIVQAAVVKGEDEDEVELKGKIDAGSIAGTCGTNFSFKVNGTLVTTSATTRFKDVQCSSLKAGDSVEVKGIRNADGSISATRVEKD
jgi:hypothetical protein